MLFQLSLEEIASNEHKQGKSGTQDIKKEEAQHQFHMKAKQMPFLMRVKIYTETGLKEPEFHAKFIWMQKTNSKCEQQGCSTIHTISNNAIL